MMRTRFAIFIAAVMVTTSAFADAPTTATIVVNVSTFRNMRGLLGCQLYNTQNGFPDKWPTQSNLNQRVAVTGRTTTCTFSGMVPGTYAVAVIHDENSNGKLDTNFIGVPTEGYGISNNHTHALSRPSWDESKFTVNAGTTVTTNIALRY